MGSHSFCVNLEVWSHSSEVIKRKIGSPFSSVMVYDTSYSNNSIFLYGFENCMCFPHAHCTVIDMCELRERRQTKRVIHKMFSLC